MASARDTRPRLGVRAGRHAAANGKRQKRGDLHDERTRRDDLQSCREGSGCASLKPEWREVCPRTRPYSQLPAPWSEPGLLTRVRTSSPSTGRAVLERRPAVAARISPLPALGSTPTVR